MSSVARPTTDRCGVGASRDALVGRLTLSSNARLTLVITGGVAKHSGVQSIVSNYLYVINNFSNLSIKKTFGTLICRMFKTLTVDLVLVVIYRQMYIYLLSWAAGGCTRGDT